MCYDQVARRRNEMRDPQARRTIQRILLSLGMSLHLLKQTNYMSHVTPSLRGKKSVTHRILNKISSHKRILRTYVCVHIFNIFINRTEKIFNIKGISLWKKFHWKTKNVDSVISFWYFFKYQNKKNSKKHLFG